MLLLFGMSILWNSIGIQSFVISFHDVLLTNTYFVIFVFKVTFDEVQCDMNVC